MCAYSRDLPPFLKVDPDPRAVLLIAATLLVAQMNELRVLTLPLPFGTIALLVPWDAERVTIAHELMVTIIAAPIRNQITLVGRAKVRAVALTAFIAPTSPIAPGSAVSAGVRVGAPALVLRLQSRSLFASVAAASW